MDNSSTGSETIEIRFHGRGGQGVVTAAKLLAEASMKEGNYFQALPDYGGERMGAPIRAYTRIGSKPIVVNCQVTTPNIVVVVDPTLIGFIDVTEGVREDGVLVINSPYSPKEIRLKISNRKWKVGSVNATHIALLNLKRNIPNVPMLGALVKATNLIKKETLVNVIRQKLAGVVSPSIVEANIMAFDQAYDECQID